MLDPFAFWGLTILFVFCAALTIAQQIARSRMLRKYGDPKKKAAEVAEQFEHLKAQYRSAAEQAIVALKNGMSVLKAEFSDPAACDLSDIEAHLAVAEEHFAAGRYPEAINELYGSMIAVHDATAELKQNGGRQMISINLTVKTGEPQTK
jgi:hypothetical protein